MKITGYILLVTLILFCSCGRKIADTSKGCVTAFINAVEQHDMEKAWDCLGKDAKVFYNDLGDKTRKSGKGALENEINRIKSFRNAQKDYIMKKDKDNENNLHLNTSGGADFLIEMVDEDGAFKIKDGNSVRAILKTIAGEVDKQNPY